MVLKTNVINVISICMFIVILAQKADNDDADAEKAMTDKPMWDIEIYNVFLKLLKSLLTALATTAIIPPLRGRTYASFIRQPLFHFPSWGGAS